MISWDVPPNENASALSYFVQVSGPDYHHVYETDRQYIEWPSPLNADDTYSVNVLAHHIASNINGSYGAGPSFKMPSGTPGPCKYLNAIYTFFDDRSSRLSIVWEPPTVRNGTIRNYTILWLSDDSNRDCAVIYNRPSGPIITTTSDPSVLTMDFNDPEGLSVQDVRARGFLMCITAVTHAGMGEWNHTFIGREGIVDFSTSGNNPDTGSETALYIVSVVTIMAIIAAIVIVAVFAILCYLNKRNKKTPSSSPPSNSNGRAGGRLSISSISMFKNYRSSKVTTPKELGPTESMRSTVPMVSD